MKLAIFDVGGVVVAETGKAVRQDVAVALGTAVGTLKEAMHDLYSPVKKGKLSLLDFYREAVQRLGSKAKPEAILAVHLATYKKHAKLLPEVVTIIEHVRKNVRTVCLTNAEIETVQFNKARQLFQQFDASYISTDLKMMKPEDEIFKKVLAMEKVKPEEVVFIDDDPDFVKAAKKLGMPSIQFRDYRQLTKELAKKGILTFT
ncbi:HAD family phosphatase [Candidatus Woesearchaeota archaeon]|nr:HAD family phosphatase [Candidatus Woesearchaeota archaeon]